MIAEVHYGGRITDDFDRRLMNTYCSEWLNPTTITTQFGGFAQATGKDSSKLLYTTPYHEYNTLTQLTGNAQ